MKRFKKLEGSPQLAGCRQVAEHICTFQNAEVQLWKRIAVKAKVEQQ